ncbi:MAG: C-type lectin domain-containing protein [Deltaproteobacteria bacterium]|nr:C-type lectin domain-containing protein [Deltaproteobacteria bacterium]
MHHLTSWEAAEIICRDQGFHLVRIDDAAENATVRALVTQLAGNYEFYIGASDLAVEGSWRWSDGELFWLGGPAGAPAPGLYANWIAGVEPNNFDVGTEDVAVMTNAGDWNDVNPSGVRPYVCERN